MSTGRLSSRQAGAESGPNIPLLDTRSMWQEVEREVVSYWQQSLRTQSFIGGPSVQRFEEEWARYCEVPYAVATANGTDALQLILRALGIGPGDEVLVPANTFTATAAAVVLAGGQPRFVDVDEDTLLITPELLSAAVTPRTAAVIVVHLFGQMPDMARILAVAARHGLAVIEDAAQAHGATWNARKAGSFGIAGAFSFYPGKNLGACGDAGAVVTADPEIALRVRALANHGRASSHHDHVLVGTNSRMDAMQATVLSAKLHQLDRWNAQRRKAMDRYRENLRHLPIRLPTTLPGVVGAYHLNVIRVPQRDLVRDWLEAQGVRTGIHYPTPCHQQPAYIQFAGQALPVAEAAAPRLLSIPLSPHMTDEQIDRVSETLQDALALAPEKTGSRS